MPDPKPKGLPDLTDDVELERSTALGAQGIFRRFVVVLVVLEILMGAGMLVYDVQDSTRTTHDQLEATGEVVARMALQWRQDNPQASDQEIIDRASRLSGMPTAVIGKDGAVLRATDPGIREYLPRVYPEGASGSGERFMIREELGSVSGGWITRPFYAGKTLLVIVPRLPEAEGRLLYFTISAGVLGLGSALSVLAMLATANWMLRHPLGRLVQQLTGALARDVERRRIAEKEAVEARMDAEDHLAFLDNLINASDQVGIVATDAHGRIQILNRAAETILGCDPHDTLGKLTLADLRTRTARQSLKELPLHSLMRLQAGEEFVVDRDGAEHLVAVNYSSIVDGDGNTNGSLMVFIDITERKRLEVELQLNELQLIQSAKLAGLGEMATGVAHELNQPLNNIGLLTSRMVRKLDRSSPDAEFMSEKLQKVQGQVQRASKIIDQLRTFGRTNTMKVSSFPVRRPIESVLDLLRQQFASRGIRLDVDVPDDLPEIKADEAQLEQVLINLLNNARDALDQIDPAEREPAIKIKAETEPLSVDASSPKLCLHVEDNGMGMNETICARVFEPFFTTKEVGKGTGLGLSISYGLVKGFGGTLAVRSKPSEGTIFTVLLPVARAPGATQVPTA